MRTSVRRRGVAAVIAVLLGGAPQAYPAAGEPWPIQGGEVVVVVPLEPGGAFEATTSSLSGAVTPGSDAPLGLAGEITVDLASVDTGIALRNEHMRERLEVSRGRGFAEAVLSEIVLSEAEDTSFRGATAFTGQLLLHGVRRRVSGDARILPAGSSVRVEASFVLDLPTFAIEPPSYMGVGVSNRLVVKVSFSAAPEGTGR